MADGAIWQAIGDWNSLTSGVGVGGTIDITGSGGGVTPSGCLIFYSLRPASLPGTTSDCSRGIGMAVASPAIDYGCAYISSEDAQSSSDTSYAFGRKGEALDAALVLLTPGTDTVLVRLTVDSFIANGVRLEIQVDSDSTEMSIIVVCFENDTAMGVIDTDSQTTVSDVDFGISNAFRIFATSGANTYGATANDATISVAMGNNSGQSIIAQHELNSESPTITANYNFDDSIALSATTQWSYHRYGLTNESGATADITLVSGTVQDYKILWFAADVDSQITHGTLPSSTGNDAMTGAGFAPSGIIYLQQADTTANRRLTAGALLGSQSICVATSTDSELNTVGVRWDDDVTTTDTDSFAAARLQFYRQANLDHIATVSSWDADGATLNYTQADAATYASRAFLKGRTSSGAITEDTLSGTLTSGAGAALTTLRGVPLQDDASPPNSRDLATTIVPADITGNLRISLTWTWTTASQGTVYLLTAEKDANNGVYIFHNGTQLVYRTRDSGTNTDTTEAHSYSAGDEKTLEHVFTTDVSGIIGSTVKFGRDGSDGSRATMSLRVVEMLSLKVEEPEISPDSSDPAISTSTSLELTISTETDGATIYYTLDETEPEPDASPPVGTVYTAPFTIVDDARIRVKASLTDWATSDEVDETYDLATAEDLPQITEGNRVWTRYEPPAG